MSELRKDWAALAKKIRAIYKQAAAEVAEKINSYMAGHTERAHELQAQLAAGKITKADYSAWLKGQVFQGDRWHRVLAQITRDYVSADEKARALIGEADSKVFRSGLNEAAADITGHTPVSVSASVSFDIYDQHTVDRLLRDDPQILPEWKIDEPKDYVWNEKRVQNVITQAVIQGESIDRIAARLTDELAARNEKKMRTFARTAMTGAHNAGRVERLKEAEGMGIRVLKKWLAVHDSRTRDAHAHLDGQTAKPDEPFQSDLGPIQFPGDPSAEPANTYNCRCTLVYVYPDFD